MNRRALRFRWAALGLSLGIASSAGAEDTFWVIGFGMGSCGDWTAARRAPSSWEALARGEWILGYVVGVAEETHIDLLRGTDADGVWAWIDNYCATDPLKTQKNAADAFITSVLRRKFP